jgi:hypothetical protein
MDASDVIRLLNTSHYSPANLEEVNDLCRNYPMFNLAHMLKVRIREALGHQKEEELRLAAVYSSDRRQLYALVNEIALHNVPETEEEEASPDPVGIQFSEEPHQQADVIIVQHAPYAAPEPDENLLELDEEASEEPFKLEEEEELSSENLIRAMVKDETDMEEPESEKMEMPSIDVAEEEETGSESKKLIENFIKGDPGPIRADRNITLKGDVSVASIREHDGFITDTLAKIYVKQGLYAKAIYAYEKLSLKYPEKSAYFAAQIEKIRNINES